MATCQDIVACDICKQEPLQHFCNGCEVRLCKICVVTHLDSESVEGHIIVPYKYRDARNIQPRVCLNHRSEIKTLYCRGCFEQICVRCIDEHGGHDLIDLKQFVNMQYMEIDKASEYLRIKLLPNSKKSIEKMKLLLEKATTKYAQGRQRILDAGKDLHSKVDEGVDVLLGELDKQEKEALVKLQDLIKSTEAKLQDIENAIDMCEATKSSLDDVLKFNFDKSSLDIARTVDVTFPQYRAPSKYTVDVGSLKSIREEKRILDEPYGKNNQSLGRRKQEEDNPRMKSILTPSKNKPTVSGKDYIKLVIKDYEDNSSYSEAVKEYDDLLSTKVYGILKHRPVVPFKEENVTNEQREYKPNLAKILVLACKDRDKNYSLAWREYIDLIEKHKAAVCQQEALKDSHPLHNEPSGGGEKANDQEIEGSDAIISSPEGKTLTLFELLDKDKDKDSEEYEEAQQDLVHMFTCQAVLKSTFPQANLLPHVTVKVSKPEEVPETVRERALYRYLVKLKPETYDNSYNDIWREYATLLMAENLLDLARKANGPDRNIYLIVEKRQFYAMQSELQKKTEEAQELSERLRRFTK